MQVVGKVDSDEDSCGRGVYGHVFRGVVKELGPGVTLHVVRVVVTPPQLDVDPVLLCSGRVQHGLGVGEQRESGQVPLVGREQKDVGPGAVIL